ncbi:cytosolic acyl coenzyme A thioester hydrolase isoform X2 [Gadus morhua]|uniref:Acyl-CoA thioesterase 7 n=1 Tax=Gadus morhua TaxID=8049 RepID=A0A8C4ZLV5_GADMO|nr:cytosolic acyl coenzyme A thioester hydrolase isoform X2 [Gadus morhua]
MWMLLCDTRTQRGDGLARESPTVTGTGETERPRMNCFMPRGTRRMIEERRLHNERQQVLIRKLSREMYQEQGSDPHLGTRHQLSRLMRPDDANIFGSVHGGTILRMIEEAGGIISTRHCNTQDGDRCVAVLGRVEKTEFLSPMFIGEVAHVCAEITYTSEHSVEVQVHVMSENVLTGSKKLTNKAALWYVPCSLKNVDKILDVPPIKYTSPEQEEAGRKRHEVQRTVRQNTTERNEEVPPPASKPEIHTVGFSQSSLIHLVGPNDCMMNDFVHGGVTMKLMDEVAGIVGARHCNTRIVTACVDAINFHRKIKKGSLLKVQGRMAFTSPRSMEIQVIVDVEPLIEADKATYRAVSAFFTFISLDKDNRPLPVPLLKVEGEEEQRRFDEGKERYLQNKARRIADSQVTA